MLERDLEQLINTYINEDYFPGIVIRIVKGKELILQKAYGYASVKPFSTRLALATHFDLASLTKIVMTSLTLRLITTNRLKLEQSVLESLPRLRESSILSEYFSKVTLEQLLTHASGLTAWHPFYVTGEDFYKQLEELINTKRQAEAGTYSDLNFMLVGEIIKEVTGLSLREAVGKYISRPLGLKTLTYGPLELNKTYAEVGDKPSEVTVAATGFGNPTELQLCQNRGLTFIGWRPSSIPIWGEVNDGNAFHYWQHEAGHAGLFGTCEDVSRVGELYLNQGMWQGEQLIHPDLVKRAMTRQVGIRGLGWEFSTIYPKGCGHTGFTGTCLWLNPEADLVVTTLTNRLHVAEPKDIQPFRRACHQLIYESIGDI